MKNNFDTIKHEKKILLKIPLTVQKVSILLKEKHFRDYSSTFLNIKFEEKKHKLVFRSVFLETCFKHVFKNKERIFRELFQKHVF